MATRREILSDRFVRLVAMGSFLGYIVCGAFGLFALLLLALGDALFIARTFAAYCISYTIFLTTQLTSKHPVPLLCSFRLIISFCL